jgi:hypothetical protein
MFLKEAIALFEVVIANTIAELAGKYVIELIPILWYAITGRKSTNCVQ